MSLLLLIYDFVEYLMWCARKMGIKIVFLIIEIHRYYVAVMVIKKQWFNETPDFSRNAVRGSIDKTPIRKFDESETSDVVYNHFLFSLWIINVHGFRNDDPSDSAI
jgi:hypothetical protein